MKCTKCENEVAFEWPEEERDRRLMQLEFYGPLCETCCPYYSEFNKQLPAGASPVIRMWRKPKEEAEEAILAFFDNEDKLLTPAERAEREKRVRENQIIF